MDIRVETVTDPDYPGSKIYEVTALTVGTTSTFTGNIDAIPEPGVTLLFGLGAGVFCLRRRCR